ncbi:acyl-CoA dehydrogenase [Sphingomonas sp. CROZ-RG-20F-R02-07]|uniref:acyl-CoA dehydrogenase n=1 Tax=Sphingomonas sp. CROZ-RG-20F-R02-07 TaxID=2914832 RepID=UPI001F5B00A6|nr:acyl-CoA dehydrogenase [Sphingomonas sp. CROZ-RG-20F-R02-07]
MAEFQAPIDDIAFALERAGLAAIDPDAAELSGPILEAAAGFATGVLAPLNRPGDVEGCTWTANGVRTPAGWVEAYRALRDGGWTSLGAPEAYGGQNLPLLLANAVGEIWHAANLSFGLCPLLTLGGVELLLAHGTDVQRKTYLPKLVSGEWTATMNLTEPQAGSDLSQVRSRAAPTEDGRYAIVGQKIFISCGEHDLADNIVHLVLARLPDAPEGTRGISLFVVPKYLVEPGGDLGARNGVRCVSIEHKLGLRACPTAVMQFGDDEPAIGDLVGEPHRGLQAMFTMMNNARLGVGLEGLGIAQRAYGRAAAYAAERVQGRDADGPVAIDVHADVRRMLATMRAKVAGARGLLYLAAAELDRAHRLHEPGAQAMASLLIPIVKAWATQVGCEVADLSVQVHGGMGYIEETGVAQDLRDARILPIYEGTNGIQALDLLRRKVLADGGATASELFDRMDSEIEALRSTGGAVLAQLADRLAKSEACVRQTTAALLTRAQDRFGIDAAATPYLQMVALTCAAWILAGDARVEVARSGRSDGARVATALFFFGHLLPAAFAFAETALADPAVLRSTVMVGKRVA